MNEVSKDLRAQNVVCVLLAAWSKQPLDPERPSANGRTSRLKRQTHRIQRENTL